MNDKDDGIIGSTDRRSVLKLLGSAGAVGALGTGLASFSGSAAAAAVNITASNPGVVANDRGDLTEVTVNPDFDVTWSGMDDAVGKVFWLLEASVDGGAFWPLYRATPWLPPDTISTTGTYDPGSFQSVLGRRVVVADEDGRPTYSSFDFSGLGGVDHTSFMNGVSMGSADEYTQSGAVGLNGEILQNNFPSENAGYYGAASDTAPFDNDVDGTTADTGVQLRYTVELQRPNLSQLEYVIAQSSTYTMPSGYDANTMSDQERKEALAGVIADLRPADIDVGNSRIVMNGEDGQANFGTPSGIPYGDLRSNAGSHAGIVVTTANFTVSVENEPAQGGASGNTNPGAGDGGQP